MPVQERRKHFRVDDYLFFEYKEVTSGELYSDMSISNELLGEHGQRYLEAAQYLQNIDYELSRLTQTLGIKEPALAHYLNLLNSKIDYLARQMLMSGNIQMREANIGLGGMAFKTTELFKEKAHLKIVIYTKPQMIPIFINATVTYSHYQGEANYRTSVEFDRLTSEQELLLTQHILLAQEKSVAE